APTDSTSAADPASADTTPEGTVTTETETVPEETVTVKVKVKGKSLQAGSSGNRVRQLQAALIALGLLEEGADDGDFGSGTKRAVQAFQLEKGLKANGVANKKTIRQINISVKKGDRFDDFETSTSTTSDGSDSGSDAGTGSGNGSG
ncbi:MAG: peptidoglycan-binding protein, partial [Gaiellales bacterium]